MSKNLSELGALELKNLAEQRYPVGEEVKRRIKERDNIPPIIINGKGLTLYDALCAPNYKMDWDTEVKFDLSLLSGESLSKAQDIILAPREHSLRGFYDILNELARSVFCGTIFHHPTEGVIVQVKLKDNDPTQNHD